MSMDICASLYVEKGYKTTQDESEVIPQLTLKDNQQWLYWLGQETLSQQDK